MEARSKSRTYGNNTVAVIDTVTNAVIATISISVEPFGVAVTPDGSKVYVGNYGGYDYNGATSTVSVISTATNTVIASVSVGSNPFDVAVTPDGSKVYVANYSNGSCSTQCNTVSVIATASNTVIGINTRRHRALRRGGDPGW